ncbi:peptidyl-tRNA hydrolase [Plectosphaerella cucumerina]|uniref:peptidyl-tRNA hydrolase n=1 Tax=Plectosphaerella cucumerina TaxID=40658 RepID=A0A8K0T6Y4_9PEZI|nr:peptidyl-tRNA hydrolase [Plectosphaerella cucumerina]
MADALHVVIITSTVALLTGFGLGFYSSRGYLISPELKAERHAYFNDPLESDESDVDEDDTNLDHAPNWANGLDADRRDGLRQRKGQPEKKASAKKAAAPKPEPKIEAVKPAPAAEESESEEETEKAPIVDTGKEECKLVLVVRTDLGMTKGKIAAQCSHATLACYKALSRAAAKNGPSSAEAKILSRWERYGQAKIAVQTKSQDELKTLRSTARAIGVTAEVIQDAGRTQIDPGSLTVLGVGPAPKSLVDTITGHLKLL